MAMEYEGEESVYYAFELLGEIAMTELMEDQGVSAASELFIDYIDVSIFEQILIILTIICLECLSQSFDL